MFGFLKLSFFATKKPTIYQDKITHQKRMYEKSIRVHIINFIKEMYEAIFDKQECSKFLRHTSLKKKYITK